MKRGEKNLKQGLERCQSIAHIVSNHNEITFDLVIEILVRLPTKSLMRFKCVSNQWSSLISGPYFLNLFLMVNRQQQPRLYMCFVDETWQRVLLSASSTSPDNTSFVVDQDLTIPRMGGVYLNGLRGLMCFSVKKKVCIYNSTTRQLLTLPAVKSYIIAEQRMHIADRGQRKDTWYYIGHDPVNDQYKIVCTIVISSEYYSKLKSEHWVFLLEAGGGSWKKVVPLEDYHPHFPSSLGQVINGSVVYYMAWLDMFDCAVVSFDIVSEELTTIPVPHEPGNMFLPAFEMKAGLIERGGKIAVFNHTYLKDEGSVDLWVLEDAGKKKWSKKTLVLQPCQRHLVNDTELVLKGTTQDGKVILAPWKMRSQFYILFYDMRLNDLRKVEIKGVPHPWFDKDCYSDLKFMDESESNLCFKSLNCF